jgi:hypothetical protein
MSEPAKIKWPIAGEEVANCNCSWGCPCQFNARPTTEDCEALIAFQISDGYFGNTRLDGGPYWEIFAAICPNLIDPLFAPITLEIDREKRRATIRISGAAESEVEPIKNPVTGEEHRARIVLPDGFEFKEADMGNTVHCRVGGGDKLSYEFKNTYARLNAFDWSN